MMVKSYELTAFFNNNGFTIDTEITKNKNFYYDEKLLDKFKADKYKALYNFGFGSKNEYISQSLLFLYDISSVFINEISQDSEIEITNKAKPANEQTLLNILHRVPFALGVEHININWIRNIWDKLCDVFDDEITNFNGTVADYLHYKNSEINVAGRVFFHLVENKDEKYPFAFLATYSTGNSKNVSHMPLKNALVEHGGNQEKLLKLLSTVSKTTDKSDFISELVESGELFSPLKFTKDETYTFLKEIQIYEECGIVCRIPDWWKKKGSAKLSVSIGDKEPSVVGVDALIAFKPEFYLGDIKMTKSEIEALLSQTSGLSFIKGKWIEVDHQKLQEILNAFSTVDSMGKMTFAEAMRMQLNLGGTFEDETLKSVEITNGQWLKSIKKKLANPAKIENINTGKDFKAILRHYQQTGLDWLNFMKNLGFGALLADDMGLGKTVQILALLEYLRKNSIKTLLIVPASLICNWQNEIEKFAPEIKYMIIHKDNKDFNIQDADLFITTYGMVLRTEKLSLTTWDLIILDEAQAIKNAGTKQSKAVKEIKSKYRIAMTGTPIENRLSDLWSVFDFLNKGLLGTAKEFGEFAKSLKENSDGYARLRGIIGPFILRRLKTDKHIISDLPDKIEIKAFTTLTKKQIVLYNSLVKDLEKTLKDDKLSNITRKGIILSSIMKFKQICNHPDQYLGQKTFDFEASGKFKKLAEICETIHEKHEKVLIFTQFREITTPLSSFLETVFDKTGLVLHGGTNVKKRGEMVEKFNDNEEYIPFMVLSLKAGGVGLNLTSANHVIHFDRWWNPAIENQATDRAFRIGQQKNVMVHKFITEGTIEEKIDKMLEEKQKLSRDIIASSGENYITKMNNEELFKLFKLEA